MAVCDSTVERLLVRRSLRRAEELYEGDGISKWRVSKMKWSSQRTSNREFRAWRTSLWRTRFLYALFLQTSDSQVFHPYTEMIWSLKKLLPPVYFEKFTVRDHYVALTF